jgi:hypothetical protein
MLRFGATFQVDFPKSRVHAKLLRSLILECYQTIEVRSAWTIGKIEHSGAYRIGKRSNLYANQQHRLSAQK